MNSRSKHKDLSIIVNFVLDVGTFLLSSGAHCGRISRNVNRIVSAWGVEVEIYYSFTGISLTAYYKDTPDEQITRYKHSPSYGVNFNAINEISQLSWLISTKQIAVEEASNILQQIKNLKPYGKLILLLGIGTSCASLCIIAGGDWRAACIAFAGSIAGMLTRMLLLKKNFNAMIAITLAALITTLITGLNAIGVLDPLWGASQQPNSAIATAVLYLVPGVPLTNCIIDLTEGYIPTALFRAAFGAFILLCIAVGMSLSIFMLGIQHF